MTTIPVKDANGATVNLEVPLAAGRAAATASRPAVWSNEDQAAVGIITELAPTTDIASSGLNGRLQRIAQRLTTLITGGLTVQPGNTANTTAWLVNPGLQLGAGVATATTARVALDQNQSPITVSQGAYNGGVWQIEGKTGGTGVKLPITMDPAQLSPIGQTTGAASASVVLAGDYGMPLATDKMVAGTTGLTPQFALIAVSASGDNSIVPLSAGKKIRVLALKITANGVVNAKWRSAANDKTGLSYFAAAGDGEVLPFNPLGWFETNAGEALQVNLSTGVAVGGHLTFVAV